MNKNRLPTDPLDDLISVPEKRPKKAPREPDPKPPPAKKQKRSDEVESGALTDTTSSSTRDLRPFSSYLDNQLKAEFKILAIKTGKKEYELLTEAVSDLVQKYLQ